MIIYGTQLYGKVDHLPGLFYVATQFGHIWFVPLVPVGSYLILDDGKERGISIGLSGKSVLFAYGRLALFIGGVIAFIMTLVKGRQFIDDKADLLTFMLPVVAVPICFYLLYRSYRNNHPSPQRAVEIAKAAGLPVEIVAQYLAITGAIPGVQDVQPAGASPSDDVKEALPADPEPKQESDPPGPRGLHEGDPPGPRPHPDERSP